MKASWAKSVSSFDLIANIVHKLRRLRENLKRWSRKTIRDIFLRKRELIDKIEALDS